MSASAFTSFAYGQPSVSVEKDWITSLRSFTLPVSTRARRHLVNVYSTLLLTVACAAVGSMAHLRYHIGGMVTHLASVLLALAITVMTSSSSPYQQPSSSSWIKGVPNSLLMLCALGFVQGASIGPLIEMAVYLDSSLIVTAFVLTANVFLCFTLTALYVPKRTVMALSSILSQTLTFLVWVSLLSLFFPTVWGYSLQLYVGLLLFSGYVLVDTNTIIDAAERGDADAVRDAMRLFTNLVAIFVRILIILMQNSKKDDGDRRRKTVRR